MKDIETFALYEIRKGLYKNVKDKINKVQTSIATLNTEIRCSDPTKEPQSGKKVDQVDLLSLKDSKQLELDILYKDYSYNKRLYEESKKEIEELEKIYKATDFISKNKNIFYIYYLSQFSTPRKSKEKISEILGISYEHTRKLSRQLFLEMSKNINKIKKGI